MARDFETDADFQRELDWVDDFVEREVEPPLDLMLGQPRAALRQAGAAAGAGARAPVVGPPCAAHAALGPAGAAGALKCRCR